MSLSFESNHCNTIFVSKHSTFDNKCLDRQMKPIRLVWFVHWPWWKRDCLSHQNKCDRREHSPPHKLFSIAQHPMDNHHHRLSEVWLDAIVVRIHPRLCCNNHVQLPKEFRCRASFLVAIWLVLHFLKRQRKDFKLCACKTEKKLTWKENLPWQTN